MSTEQQREELEAFELQRKRIELQHELVRSVLGLVEEITGRLRQLGLTRESALRTAFKLCELDMLENGLEFEPAQDMPPKERKFKSVG